MSSNDLRMLFTYSSIFYKFLDLNFWLLFLLVLVFLIQVLFFQG